jgi:hypothetical protein
LPKLLLDTRVLILIQEQTGLRLEILYAEVRGQYVLCQLLLQLFLDFLAETLVD